MIYDPAISRLETDLAAAPWKVSRPVDVRGGPRTGRFLILGYTQPKMKIQLCLLSGELMPNVIGILHERPDVVIPVTTMEFSAQVARLEAALRAAGCRAEVHDPVTVLPYDLGDCVQSIRRACKEVESLTINWTGGTKIMSHAARTVAESAGARVKALYVNTTDRQVLVEENPSNRQPRVEMLDTARLGLNTLVHILAAGHRVTADGSLDAFRSAHTPAPELEAAAEAIVDARSWEWPDLYKLSEADGAPYRPQRMDHRLLQILETAKIIERASQSGAFFLARESLALPFHLNSPQEENAKFIKGGYLEVFLWSQLKHRGAFDDVAWHIVLNPGQQGRVTELDVAVASEGRFLVVECKGRVDLSDLADLIEEQFARTRRIGRLFGSWILYIHQFKNAYHTHRDQSIIASQEARAREYGGMLLWHDDLAEFPILVASFLNEKHPTG